MAEILSEFGHLVGLVGGNNIQATTMPTYSSVPLGTIVQYIGTTTADYINGYFYKATATGWEQHDTQPASNADNSITAFKESSPALAAHAVDEYIRYNNITYIVTAAIAIGDNLVIGTNIVVPELDEGTVIYTPEVGGSINGVVDVLVDGQSVVDENGEAHINTPNASSIGYNNTASELEATNTQDAIDEVVDIVADKVDKVSSATNGNLAGLDASGNLADSGIASSIFPSGASPSDKLVKASENNFKYSVTDSTQNIDFNTLISPGTYSIIVRSRSEQHAPEMFDWYQVYVTCADNNTNWVQQLAIHTNGNSYIRTCQDATWGSWNKLIKESNVMLKNPFGANIDNIPINEFLVSGPFSFSYMDVVGLNSYVHFRSATSYSDCSFILIARGGVYHLHYAVNENNNIYGMTGYASDGTSMPSTDWYVDSNGRPTYRIGDFQTFLIIGICSGGGAYVSLDSNA